ncbi:MAG: T9SS type A sorting domain-containing protein [Nonlabens sp.]
MLLFSTDCAGTLRWSKTFGGGMTVFGGGLETDALGGVYVSGIVRPRSSSSQPAMQFDTDFAFDPNGTTSNIGNHNKEFFVVKYNTQGIYQWISQPQFDNPAAGEGAARNYGMVVEADGTITVQTLFIAGTHFNGNIVVPAPFKGLVIQMNKDGNYLNHFEYDIGGEITYDRNVTYHYDPLNGQHYFGLHKRIGGGGAVSFGGVQQTGDALIVALDATGTELWRHDSMGVNNLKSITTDDQSNVYISGAGNNSGGVNQEGFAGHVFDQVNSPTISGGELAIYVIKLNSSGMLQWGTNPTYSTGGISTGYALQVNGNEVAMGGSLGNANTWSGINFNRPLLSSAQDPVVVRFNKNTGTVIAIEDIEGPSGFDDEITALGVDNFGNYIVGGYVTNSLFLNDPNVPVITNGTGDSDFWFGQLAKTDCAGVLLSNEDLQQSRASIYPNPAVNEIQINSDLEFSSVSIYNVNGQQVLTQILNSDQRLNISTLSNGVYFLKLENNGLEIKTL